MKGEVLVLNQNYEPLNLCAMRRAVSLVYLGRAETVLSYDGEVLRSERMVFKKPSIIKLFRYVKIKRREIPLTKKAIFRRDSYTCQYCASSDGNLTIDHVIPKRLNGGDSWNNLVCACSKCNNQKGDLPPWEAKMWPMRKPKRPSYFLFLFAGHKLPDTRWRPFLFLE